MTLSDIEFRDAVFPSVPTPDVCAAAVSDRWTALCVWLATFSGEADREAVARAAALGLAERGAELSGRPITGELFRDARAAAVRAGLSPTDDSVKWLREIARLDLGRTGSILGMPITEVAKRHADVAWSRFPAPSSDACISARREFLAIWLDDLRSPAAVLSRSHRDGCEACASAWSAIAADRRSVEPAHGGGAAPTVAEYVAVAARKEASDRRRRAAVLPRRRSAAARFPSGVVEGRNRCSRSRSRVPIGGTRRRTSIDDGDARSRRTVSSRDEGMGVRSRQR